MCTRPPLFLWLIIIEQYWPGVLKLHRSEASGFWGAGMPKFRINHFVRLLIAKFMENYGTTLSL